MQVSTVHTCHAFVRKAGSTFSCTQLKELPFLRVSDNAAGLLLLFPHQSPLSNTYIRNFIPCIMEHCPVCCPLKMGGSTEGLTGAGLICSLGVSFADLNITAYHQACQYLTP